MLWLIQGSWYGDCAVDRLPLLSLSQDIDHLIDAERDSGVSYR